MFVAVAADGVSLADADVFTDLHAEFTGVAAAAAAQSLSDFDCGRLVGDHVWVNLEWLRTNGSPDEAWQAKFRAMIDYARTKGWVSEDGQQVRAHLVGATR